MTCGMYGCDNDRDETLPIPICSSCWAPAEKRALAVAANAGEKLLQAQRDALDATRRAWQHHAVTYRTELAECLKRRGITADLAEAIAGLEIDARRALLVLARRLKKGQRYYGAIRIATDARNWRKEREEELADALIYGAFGELKSSNPEDVEEEQAEDEG